MVYIDEHNHCHLENPDGIYTPIVTEFFVGKCDAFVEGYTIDDSKGYRQIYPWKPYSELEEAQRDYERQQLADYKAACERMGIVV